MNVENGKITFTSVEIEALQDRFAAYKAETGKSWSDLSTLSGVKMSTLQAWATKKYAGDNEKVAGEVHRFFEGLESKAAMLSVMPKAPDFQMIPTAERFLGLLAYAHMGEIVAIAGPPGICKTTSCRYYKATAANVFIVTMTPATAGVQPMQLETLAAIGLPDASGSPQQMSRKIKGRLAGTDALLIYDDAQHMSVKAIEEVRAWHDALGLGVALVGNDRVLTRLEGGARSAEFAQLYSRISMRALPKGTMAGDAEALIAAWGITDKAMVAFCVGISEKPGALRQMTKTIKAAWLAANGAQTPLTLAHLRNAWTQLSLRTAE